MPEANNGLDFKLENFLAIYRDGVLVAVEAQNGHIVRYKTAECTKADSLDIFGANKVK